MTEASQRQLYKPLDPNSKEFRVLRLDECAGSTIGNDGPSFAISVVSLDTVAVYDALSYTWGDAGEVYPIRVQGEVVKIRRNLYDMLSTYADADFLRTGIFIDAVCINQDDLDERSDQVKLMRDIYSRARTVRIWLGMAARGVDALFMRASRGDDLDSLVNTQDRSLDGLAHIVRCAWWERVWILQEALLATDAIVHCGVHAIGWKTLLNACHKLPIAFLGHKFSSLQTREIGFGTGGRFGVFSRFWEKTSRIDSKMNQSLDWIAYILSSLSAFKATDPRDFVYAAMSLLPPTLVINPDYRRALLDVYRDYTMHVMRNTSSLMPLIMHKADIVDPAWPSWVPDYRDTGDELFEFYGYDASWKAKCHVDIGADASHLLVNAHFLDDEILVIGNRAHCVAPQHLEEDGGLPTLRVQAWIWRLESLKGQEFESVEAKAEHMALFWCTIKQEIPPQYIHVFHPTKSSTRQRYLLQTAGLEDFIFGPHPAPDDSRIAAESVLFGGKPFSNHSFCITKAKRMALVPQQPQLDDRIAILAGCTQPVLLRRHDEDGTVVYRIVCPLFLSGTMVGEYIHQAARDQVDEKCQHVWCNTAAMRGLLDPILLLRMNPSSTIFATDMGEMATLAGIAHQHYAAEPEPGVQRPWLFANDRTDRVKERVSHWATNMCNDAKEGAAYFASSWWEAVIKNPDRIWESTRLVMLCFNGAMHLRCAKLLGQTPLEHSASSHSIDTFLLLSGLMLFEILILLEQAAVQIRKPHDPWQESDRLRFAVLLQIESEINGCIDASIPVNLSHGAFSCAASKEVLAEQSVDKLFEKIVIT